MLVEDVDSLKLQELVKLLGEHQGWRTAGFADLRAGPSATQYITVVLQGRSLAPTAE